MFFVYMFFVRISSVYVHFSMCVYTARERERERQRETERVPPLGLPLLGVLDAVSVTCDIGVLGASSISFDIGVLDASSVTLDF